VGVTHINCYNVAEHAWECGGWCNSDFNNNDYVMTEGKKIRLEAGKACQYIVRDNNIDNVDKNNPKRFFITKTDTSLYIWKSDHKILESELRGDQALQYRYKLNVWDEAANGMIYVVMNMGDQTQEIELYGLEESEYFVDEEIEAKNSTLNTTKTGAHYLQSSFFMLLSIIGLNLY